jgi:DNA-directed RNA polymerase specialized sigma24 family protein
MELHASESSLGPRLAAQERRLRLLLAHLAGRAVRARVELDDLVQEVHLRALASPRGLPPRASDEPTPGTGDSGDAGDTAAAGARDDPALWRLLAHLARHVVIDVARALRAAKRGGAAGHLERSSWSRAPADPAPGPHTAAAAAETSRRLARAFLALPAEHRRVLGLRQFEGLSARAAAARMGRSETAVHSLYRRALLAWEAALAGADPESRDESRADPRLERT